MIKRRHFFQLTGSTLASLGLSQIDIFQNGNRYAQVLSQNTPRKLALLVGVNKYLNKERCTNLEGCVTDVDLQQQLLTHRFGFNSNDILKLTSEESADKQPTRKNILTAFEEHLIKQAKPGDVVVFHFSGHGSQLLESDLNYQKCRGYNFNSALVPADDIQNGKIQDIMGKTLFLLKYALNTENVTFVLDSCYSGGGTRGNFLIRSVTGDNLRPSPEEIAYQQRWMEKLKISPQELTAKRCAKSVKGVVLAAAQPKQEAADIPFGGFSAGAFTYLLTQYLWQQTDSVGSAIAQITPGVKGLHFSQLPLADGEKNKPVYFINNKIPPTDAVIIKSSGDRATLWLGGVDRESLDTFRPGAKFAVVNSKGQISGTVELISPRSGLSVEAKLVEKGEITSLLVGMLLQESTRVIPADLKLSIGLDPSLARDTNAAKEALSVINRIATVTPQQGNVPYPQGVQYIFSRMTVDYHRKLQQQITDSLPPINSIGLFTDGLELVSQSFSEIDETVTAAVKRLELKLKSLLAAYIIKKTLNANSSQLDVEVSMNLVDQPNQILAMTSTATRRKNSQLPRKIYSRNLPLQKLFQFQLTNHESTPLYFCILLFDSSGDLLVISPYQWPADEKAMKLLPNQTRVVGNPQQIKLSAKEKGTAEALIIVSRKSLKNSVKTLTVLAQEQKRNDGPIRGTDEVIGNLLNDLRDERGGGINVQYATPVSNSDTAALSITFDVG